MNDQEKEIENLKLQIVILRRERDAARRDFCNASYDDPHLVAKELGWDCFKDFKDDFFVGDCDHTKG